MMIRNYNTMTTYMLNKLETLDTSKSMWQVKIQWANHMQQMTQKKENSQVLKNSNKGC
jgi:hypothetical protein